MRRLYFVLTFILAVSFLIPQNSFSQAVEEKPQTVVEEEVTVVDDGMLTMVIEEKKLHKIRHILDYFLQNARDHAIAGEVERASEELEMASYYMYVDALSGSSTYAKDVQDAASQLAYLASTIDDSKTPETTIDRAILNAHHALAHFHRLRAETYLGADFEKSSGFALEAALVHYQDAALSHARLKDVSIDEVLDQDLVEELEKFSIAMQEDKNFVESDAEALVGQLEFALEELEISQM